MISNRNRITLNRRLRAWSAALVKEATQRPCPFDIGVVELAEKHGLDKKDGYKIATCGRVGELQLWVQSRGPEVEVAYDKGRYFVKVASGD